MRILVSLVGLISFSPSAFAATSYRINNTLSQRIDEFSVCKVVTNNTGRDIHVPTNTAGEWTSFRTGFPSGISMTDCCTSTPTVLTADGVYTVPVACNSVIVKSWGGGGGGGANNANESGHGGAGGYAFSNAFAVTAGNTFNVVIGLGGQAGKCANPPLGGGGAFAGGNGGQTTDGVDGVGAGVGGNGGNGVHLGGDGKYGGGGGGGMTTNQRGGGGGGATSVVFNPTATTILIAGGGGGGGGGNNSGVDLGGDAGTACGVNGGDSAPALTKGGGGGGGACVGANTANNGISKTPANSAEAGAGISVGGDDGGACGGVGNGGPGKVIFAATGI